MLKAIAPGDDKPLHEFDGLSDEVLKTKEMKAFKTALLQWAGLTRRTLWRGLVPRTFVVESEFSSYTSHLFPDKKLVRQFYDVTSVARLKAEKTFTELWKVFKVISKHIDIRKNMFYLRRCDIQKVKHVSGKCEHCEGMPPIRAHKFFQHLQNNECKPFTATPSSTHPGHMMTANEMISLPKHKAVPYEYHPSQKLVVKYMRCGMPNCSVNLHSIKAMKRHSILCHPNKAIVTTMMHHICGSKSKNGICALSFNTAAQLRKHRSLKGHVGLGRGRSVISQLLKCGLQPVKASGTDWKKKNQ